MNLIKNYTIFIIGLFFMSLGIDSIIKSMLGTSPISSIPYILSLNTQFSLGQITFIINMVFFFMQWFILRKRFEKIQLLQIPMTFIFATFIDVSMNLLVFITIPNVYIIHLMVLLLGCLSMGVGITCELLGKVVMLPGEGIVNAIAVNWHFDFGKTKIAVDCSLVIIACLLSLYYSGSIVGIREGTIISAMITGIIVKFMLLAIMKFKKQL